MRIEVLECESDCYHNVAGACRCRNLYIERGRCTSYECRSDYKVDIEAYKADCAREDDWVYGRDDY